MAEQSSDQTTPERTKKTPVERIKIGIRKWAESQMPPAVGERYKKTITYFADRLVGNRKELRARLERPIEIAAKAAGWADPMIKTAIGAAALYGGVMFLIDPASSIAFGSAVAAGAFRVVEQGLIEGGRFIKGIADRIWGGAVQTPLIEPITPPLPNEPSDLRFIEI
jgi:hypothetical protein